MRRTCRGSPPVGRLIDDVTCGSLSEKSRTSFLVLDDKVDGETRRIAARRCPRQHVVGEEVLAVRDLVDDVAGLPLGVVEESPSMPRRRKRVGAEAGRIISWTRRSPVCIAPAICALRSPQFCSRMRTLTSMISRISRLSSPAFVELHRRDADAFLVHLDVVARERLRRHRTADVGVVDVARREADEAPPRGRSASRDGCRANACRRNRCRIVRDAENSPSS